MSVTLSQGDNNLTVISAYSPQVGCEEDEKDLSWEEMDQEINSVPLNEKVMVGGDLNGDVCQEREGVERCNVMQTSLGSWSPHGFSYIDPY